MKSFCLKLFLLIPLFFNSIILFAQDVPIETISSVVGTVRGDDWLQYNMALQLLDTDNCELNTAIKLYLGAIASLKMYGRDCSITQQDIHLRMMRRAIQIFYSNGFLYKEERYWALPLDKRLTYIEENASYLSIACEVSYLFNQLSPDKDNRIFLLLKNTVAKEFFSLNNDIYKEACIKAKISPIAVMANAYDCLRDSDALLSTADNIIELCSHKKDYHEISLYCIGSVNYLLTYLTTLSLFFDNINERACNISLQLNEIMLHWKMLSYDCTQCRRTYEVISQELKDTDCAIFLAGQSESVTVCYVIRPHYATPQKILLENDKDFISQIKETLRAENIVRYYFSSNIFYDCNYDELVDSDFHNVFSLYDIPTLNEAGYSGGYILFYGDIDYGFSPDSQNVLKPLIYSKVEKDAVRRLNPKMFNSITGLNLRKIHFHAIGDSEILHVVSHGLVPLINPSSIHNIALVAFGGDIEIALSNYNIDNSNKITPVDFLKFDYSDLKLLFLSCCNTNNNRKSATGFNSLALSAYLAGAHNVIGYSSSIRDYIAADFAQSFYKHLEDCSIHDAFYISKLETIEKYKSELETNNSGRPILPVVLYE